MPEDKLTLDFLKGILESWDSENAYKAVNNLQYKDVSAALTPEDRRLIKRLASDYVKILTIQEEGFRPLATA